MRSAQLRCALMQMSSDNVAHWRPSLSRRSSFCSFPCPRRCSYRATFPCDIHGEFASRANLRSCLGARRRARWISARSMFEPEGESVRCQNLHEPLLSPCMFEPKLSLRLIFSSCADALFFRLVFSSTLIFVHAIRVLVSFCAVVAGRLPHARPSRASAQYIRRD